MADSARVIALRVRVHSDDLDCDLIRGYGYRAEVKDGWKGPVRRSYTDARQDVKVYNAHTRHGA